MIEARLDADRSAVAVTIDGKLFTEYRYGHYVCRPFLYPILTPGGERLTRAFPVEDIEGENQDHPHHRGLYVAHGLVNGCNLWDEQIGHGAMLQRGDPSVTQDGNAVRIDGTVDWFGSEGQRLLVEQRSIRICASDDLRVIDHTSELHAAYEDVTFGDTKEGGLFSIRVPTSMDAQDKGRIENSEGLVFENGQGDDPTWGKRASWVDYSGPLTSGEQWGHTMVDHPDNPRYPTYWHVRGYGLFTANPFGVSFFEDDTSLDGSLCVPKGETVTFRYRIISHPGRGPASALAVAGLIKEFQSA